MELLLHEMVEYLEGRDVLDEFQDGWVERVRVALGCDLDKKCAFCGHTEDDDGRCKCTNNN